MKLCNHSDLAMAVHFKRSSDLRYFRENWVQPQQDDSDDGASDEDHVTRLATTTRSSVWSRRSWSWLRTRARSWPSRTTSGAGNTTRSSCLRAPASR